CPLCGDPLLSAEQPPELPGQWERWWLHLARKAISADHLAHHGRPGSPPDDNHTRLVHASCRRGHRARNAGASTARPSSPQRLAGAVGGDRGLVGFWGGPGGVTRRSYPTED